MTAKFYTYRNLTKGGFSTKLRGIVSTRFSEGYLLNVSLKVSDAGNKRAVSSGVRNVHAYAVSNYPPVSVEIINVDQMKEIKYNPFRGNSFTLDGNPIHHVNVLYFKDGKCYTVCN